MPYTLETNQIGYVRITKGAAKEVSPSFSDDNILISLNNDNTSESEYLEFVYQNKQTDLKQTFRFSLQYYKASQGDDNYTDAANNPAGAYEFKPKRYEQF